ncbi:DUF3027 domain-containing protein [Rhodococcus sp. X156]|uniref:DUF3027 domain-containing protein n=1 Tax=Rhodococcus sp. X156 TaxID=2499145 RepID=UPI001F4977E7|nr:DUF3027 domain-containing protein [Rhodococcus sp. X156]
MSSTSTIPDPSSVDQQHASPQAADEQPVRAVLAAAVELARAAAVELDEGEVGAHLGVHAEPDSEGCAATHRFAAELKGYRGWEWAVVVAAAPDSDHVTISEIVLLPGPDALVSPEWLPWEERIQAGDLGSGDLLPPPENDPRLVPGYLYSDDPAVEALATEVGLGRRQVMSLEGRLDAAERWYDGPHGPGAAVVPLHCGTCGYYLPVAGSLGAAFGVCGNEMSADGQVVHAEFGCGAHSDTVVVDLSPTPVSEVVYDDSALELVDVPTRPAGDSPVPDSPVSDSPVPDAAAPEAGAAQPSEETTPTPEPDSASRGE